MPAAARNPPITRPVCRYWFAFPALQPPVPFTLAAPPVSLQAALGDVAAAAAEACSSHVAAASGTPAWLVVVSDDNQVATAPLTEWRRLQQQADGGGGDSSGSGSGSTVYLAVADSSNQATHPGWPLRNLLLMAAARCGKQGSRLLRGDGCHLFHHRTYAASVNALVCTAAAGHLIHLTLSFRQVALPAAVGALPAGAARPVRCRRQPGAASAAAGAAAWLYTRSCGWMGAQ